MSFVYPRAFDVIVVGGGHAGIEAALASARMGCQTLLLTMNCDTIGQMSCNPAIGGLGKGHLVREVDALGGEMGQVTDMTGIQFRMLNTRKGPSVWAPRAQCDKKAYQFRMKWVCERQSRLLIQQTQTTELLYHEGQIHGVRTSLGIDYHGTCVVITTGTFLMGLMHIGTNRLGGGRAGENPAVGLSSSLTSIGLELGKFKTGTPPRLLKRSIQFCKTEVQLGDEPPPSFSFWGREEPSDFEVPVDNSADSYNLFHMEQTGSHARSLVEQIGHQLPCHLTHTTQRTAEIIRKNLDKSPMYSGVIQGIGPRYCPSIEDKIIRFADKERHQIFLEPEGVATDEIYVNGFSTCLPYEIQLELIRTVVGCESAEIMRPAYAVEYDYVLPTQLDPNLETKTCRNLFLAGQINGTSGYEEAAAQGIIAGINAALRCQSKPPFVLTRDQAYIGVLIDDLVTKGTSEPYRMFTSRAEHRLLLRQDNADTRLSGLGYQVGILPQRCHEKVIQKTKLVDAELRRLRKTRAGTLSLYQLLKRPEFTYRTLPQADPHIPQDIANQVEIEVKYEGYIKRQASETLKFSKLEERSIPSSLDYMTIPSLRNEARQKLSKHRPTNLGQAVRISGITPADLMTLLVWLKRPSEDTSQSSKSICI